MKRNLRALSLAFAAFAISAVAAGGVSAGVATDEFHTDAGPGGTTHLTAEAVSTNPKQVFTATPGGNDIICEEVNAHGTIEGETAEKITVVPTYSECGVWNPETTQKLTSAIVHTNAGCGYEFTGTTDANGHAEVTVKCDEPNKDAFTITVSGFQVNCLHIEQHVGETELNGVSYVNGEVETPSGEKHRDVTLKATVKEQIKSVSTHNAFICPTPTGEAETHSTGSYTGEATVTGFADEAHTERTDIWVE